MAEDRIRQRRDITRKVMQSTREPAFRDGTLFKNDSGTFTVVPALYDDTVGYVFEQAGAFGRKGPANLVVLMGDGRVEMAVLQPAKSAAATEDADCPVTAGSHVGILMELLRERAGKPVVCRVAAPYCQVELNTQAENLATA